MAGQGQQAVMAEFRARKKQELLNTLGLGNQNPYSNYSPNVLDPIGISTPAYQRGGIGFRYGIMPNDNQIDQYVQQQVEAGMGPPDPGSSAMPGPAGTAKTAAQLAAESGATPGSELFQKLISSFQSKIDEANKANIKRYDEGHGELSDLRSRNQGRVQNWGVAATADLDERMQEALGAQKASLASHGLDSSTILPAFQGRVARDTAREAQRISEMRDSRASQYDTNDTNNLVGFVERRNDVAPDYGQLINLATQYGQSGQGQGLDAVKDEIAGLRRDAANRYQPMTQLPFYGPTSQGPQFVNMFGNAGASPVPQFGDYGYHWENQRLRDRKRVAPAPKPGPILQKFDEHYQDPTNKILSRPMYPRRDISMTERGYA